MRTTFSTVLLFILMAAMSNAVGIVRRQGEPLSSTTSPPPAQTSASSPGPVQQFSINTPVDVTTCQPANITWVYGQSTGDTLSLSVSNVGVNETTVNPAPPTASEHLASGLDPGSLTWTWPQANLPTGYYYILGSVGSYTDIQSNVFLITTGSDTSCISSSPSSALPSSTVATTSISPTSSPSSTSPITPAPVSSSKKSNTGAIVGGVMGGIAALILLGAIALVMVRNKNKAARARRSGLGVPPSPRDPFTRAKPTGTGRHHAPSESTGGMLSDIGPAIATAVDAHSDEDLYLGNEKEGSPGKSSSIDAIARLAYSSGSHHRSSSSSSLNQPITARTSLSHSRASPAEARRPSLDVADYVRSERSTSSPGAPRPFSPRTAAIAAAELIPMGRSSSGQSRRASRKPVPQYDASELQATPSDISLPTPSPLEPASGLRHKSSSGDVRPVHYLIPDLPPPGQY